MSLLDPGTTECRAAKPPTDPQKVQIVVTEILALPTGRPKKPHSGGPVPAHKMGKGLPTEDDDPRPAKYRNVKSYNDDLLYNATVNYAANSGVDVSWRYTVCPKVP